MALLRLRSVPTTCPSNCTSVLRSRKIRDSKVSRRIVYETIRVRIEGIHPASRIGIMIFERSKRSRLRFVMKFPNKMPGLAENRLDHRQPAARRRQGGIAAESQPVFKQTVPANSDIAKPTGIAIANR